MAPSPLLIVFSVVFLSSASMAISFSNCLSGCGVVGPDIRFPFGINGSGCGFPGFNLSCDILQRTILTLPNTPGSFRVRLINYQTQSIAIRDPDNCLPRRFLDPINLTGSPFAPESYRTFSFISCASASYPALPGIRPIPCMSSENNTVAALPTDFNEPFIPLIGCTEIAKSVWIPVIWPRGDAETRLVWREPDCGSCERQGGTCGLKGDPPDIQIQCSGLPKSGMSGLPRSAKYGIIIGVGIPGLLCLIGTVSYLCGRIKDYGQRRHPGAGFTATVPAAQQHSLVITGLDRPTIESYPKIQLGESKRLPNPNDNTCPICLSEYQPKETLRSIPECNHYFHADCVDEWLKVNASCPLCRKSPEGSSLTTTPSSSLSLSSSSLPTTP